MIKLKKHYRSKKMVLANLSINSGRKLRATLAVKNKSNDNSKKTQQILADRDERKKEWRKW